MNKKFFTMGMSVVVMCKLTAYNGKKIEKPQNGAE